ncbi:MAG: DoxX family protein [Sediminicola sp.]
MKFRIAYWITTAIISIMMVFSAYSYLTKEEMRQAFEHLGYPDHFRVELAVAKLLGAVVLLVPISARIKEWAYAGLAFAFIAAFVAHTAVGDPLAYRLPPLVFLGILAISYFTYHKTNVEQK